MSIWNLSSWFSRSAKLTEPASFNIGESYSGKCVTADTSLSLSTVYACAKLIAESIASLPCALYTYDKDGNKEAVKGHELYKIIHNSPNADMTAFDYWQVVVVSILLWGNSYSLKSFRGSGANKKVVSIEPLYPEFVSVIGNDDGSFRYEYTQNGVKQSYSEDQIMHIKGFSLSGRMGLSIISYAKNSFGNSLAMEETSGRLFANGMRPGGALTMPGTIKKEQRDEIRTNIADQVGGVAKSGGLIILEGGMEYKPFSIPPVDAQMLESKSFSIEDICRWFQVPPMMVGHTQNTTTWGTGLEQINLGFLTYTLQPHIKRIEQQVNKSLLTPEEREKYFMEFNIEGFLRADSKGRAELYSKYVQNGIYSRNEVRKKENAKPYDGGDEYTVQSNMIPLSMLGKITSTTELTTEKTNLEETEAVE